MGHDCRRVCSQRRHDSTRQLSRVGGVYWALYNIRARVAVGNVKCHRKFNFVEGVLSYTHCAVDVVRSIVPRWPTVSPGKKRARREVSAQCVIYVTVLQKQSDGYTMHYHLSMFTAARWSLNITLLCHKESMHAGLFTQSFPIPE